MGIGTDVLNAKLGTGYISQANLAQDFHQTNDVMMLARKAPEADGVQVRVALEKIVKGYPAFTLFAFTEWRDMLLNTLNGAMGFFYLLLAALTLPSLIALINTLAINVIERTREIGMIRAVGGTRSQVRRMILAESLLLSAAGTGFGILAGHLAGLRHRQWNQYGRDRDAVQFSGGGRAGRHRRRSHLRRAGLDHSGAAGGAAGHHRGAALRMRIEPDPSQGIATPSVARALLLPALNDYAP